MEYLVLTRPPAFGEVKIMRYVDPLDKHGRVIRLYDDPNLTLEFVHDMMLESGAEEKQFESLLVKPYSGILPSDVYIHMIDRDKIIPSTYLCKYDGREFRHIRRAQADLIGKLVMTVAGGCDDESNQ